MAIVIPGPGSNYILYQGILSQVLKELDDPPSDQLAQNKHVWNNLGPSQGNKALSEENELWIPQAEQWTRIPHSGFG